MLTNWDPAQATEAERKLMIANIANADAALEFMQDGEVIPYDVGINGLILEGDRITLSRKPAIGDEFTHHDLTVRGKYVYLRIVKIKANGALVAHDINDTNPWAPSIYYFGKGFDVFREEEIQWIEADEPAFVPQAVEEGEVLETWI